MTHEAKRDEQNPERKVYGAPMVKVVGSIDEITEGPAGGAIDGLFGGIGGFQVIITPS